MTARPAVLYVLTDYPAPSHTFIAREITALESHGIGVEVVALNRADDDFVEKLDPRARERTVSMRGRPTEMIVAAVRQLLRSPGAGVRGLLAALRLVPGDLTATAAALRGWVAALFVLDHARRIGTTHLHAHFGQAPSTVAMLAHVMAGDDDPLTYSMTIHGWHDFVEERSTALRTKASHASFVACISDFTRSQLMRIAAEDDWEKLAVVRCGLDLENFAYDPTPRDGVPVVMTVARLSAEKGIPVLLDAVAQLRDRGVETRVRIVGGGPDEESLRRRVDELDLTERVDFLGSQPSATVHAELANAAVFCLPTFAEGLPVSLMEAMAAGVPVVTTPISGIPELVVDGVTGAVVAPSRPDLVADRIERLLSDESYRAGIVAAGRDAVAEAHDIAVNVRGLAELFGPVLDRSTAGAR